MRFCISQEIRKVARSINADVYTDTEQYTYTNPGNEYPSDITYDLWPGEPSPKDNDPASKKEDEKNKNDTVKQGPGPLETDWAEKGQRPGFWEDPAPPKTNLQDNIQDNVKTKGEDYPDVSDENELDRETWVGQGIVDSFNF